MIKKSKLLSLLTAASIVLTSAGTYAAWDSITASTSSTQAVRFRNPVTVTVGQNYNLTADQAVFKSVPTASSDTIQFTVDNQGGLASTLTLKPNVTGGSATVGDFDFTITDLEDSSKPLDGNASAGFTDLSIGSTKYKVVVTPKDNDESKGRVLGQDITVTLTAELS